MLSNFLYFCSRNNTTWLFMNWAGVVNCSQIFCTFAVETTKAVKFWRPKVLWIALKFFVLLQSKQLSCIYTHINIVVNCSQIFCTFAVETTDIGKEAANLQLWIALKFFVLLQSKQPLRSVVLRKGRCELLSNFLYFCSRNNLNWL